MSKKSARLPAEQRREQILRAARAEFLTSGPRGTRTRDIAAAAGVSEALLYQHFRSKEELFEAAILEELREYVSELRANASALPPGRFEMQVQNSFEFYRELIRILDESIHLFGLVLFSDQPGGQDFYGRHIVPILDAVTATVESNLGKWPHRDFDPSTNTPIVVGMCWGAVMDAHFRGKRIDVDELANAVTQMTFHGLTNTEP